jgi:hypothetical protein
MRNFFVRWALALLLAPGICFAQALPSAVQKSVAGMVQQKMASRGFASNDPRWGATLQASGAGIVGAAAAAAVVTVAAITAPAWVTAAATVALGSLFAVGINLAIDGTVQWFMNSDGTVTVGTPPPAGTQTTIQINGDRTMNTIVGNSINKPFTVIQQTAPYYYTQTWYSTTAYVNPGAGTYKLSQNYTFSGTYYYVWATNSVQSTTPCPVNFTLNGTQCVSNGAALPMTATQAVNQLSAADLAKPVNPDVVGQIADSAWKKAAAQPGYQGYPYDAANPITTADATAYQVANPTVWPKVADIVSPQPAPAGGTAADPFILPNSAAAPVTPPAGSGTTPPAQTGTTFDWAIPAQSETVPKTEIPVSYTPTVFASPTGCPAPIQFTMFAKPYFISYQPACDLMSTLAPIFLACGAAAAALIFMEALKS